MGMLDYLIGRSDEGRERVRQAVLAGNLPHWLRTQIAFGRGGYVVQLVKSCPGWVNRDDLKRIKERCQATSELTGIPHHVAHIVPLNHPRMCGLTVPWNLEPRPAKINQAESNHVPHDDQMELFK